MHTPDTPFAYICQWDTVHLYTWDLKQYSTLDELRPSSIVMIPFSQVFEKNYAFVGHRLPLLALEIKNKTTMTKHACIQSLDTASFTLSQPTHVSLHQESHQIDDMIYSNFSDEDYTQAIDTVIKKEIKAWGEWPTFVISRQFYTKITDCIPQHINKIFADLLLAEENAHMTFLFYDGEEYFVWSTPEAHLRVKDNLAMMNPISWTLPKRDISQIDSFLEDKKEINELFQVTDEEIKMMSVICSKWWAVRWPMLKEMNSVIHTEYYLEWTLSMSVIDALRTSMFAATLVWAPVENACRIIKKYEPTSRWYYGWCIAVYGQDGDADYLDSGILIRTAKISKTWYVVLQVWASLVEYSNPAKECEETHAKVRWFVRILQWELTKFEKKLPDISPDRLDARNKQLSRFLLQPQAPKSKINKTLLLLYNRDDFLYTFGHMCSNMWYTVLHKHMDDLHLEDLKDIDCVLVWPWPWDPRKMTMKHAKIQMILQNNKKILGICLWHQLVWHVLWFMVGPKQQVTQWIAQDIEIDNVTYRMGYYNSFCVKPDKFNTQYRTIQNSFGEADLLIWKNVYTMQFHPESLLSYDGYEFIETTLKSFV